MRCTIGHVSIAQGSGAGDERDHSGVVLTSFSAREAIRRRRLTQPITRSTMLHAR